MGTAEGPDSVGPVSALLQRYAKRRKVSARELARRIDRDHRVVARMLSGNLLGLKPWQGDSTLFTLARALEIPDKELRKAIADHFQLQAADSLLAQMKASKRSRGASKTCLTQTRVEQPVFALAAGL